MSTIRRSEPTPASESPALSESEVVAANRLSPSSLIDDHRECWRRGERIPVEAYLERFRPRVVDTSELLDLIYNEVVLREEDGESPRLDEYLDRFPAHEERSVLSLIFTSSYGRAALSRSHSRRHRWSLPSPPRRRRLTRPDPSWPRVEGFDILGVLGSGGMGTVYRAFDRRSGHPVALKTLNRVGATSLLRFKHEFRTLLDVPTPTWSPSTS